MSSGNKRRGGVPCVREKYQNILVEHVGWPYTMERLSGVGGPGCHVVHGPLGDVVLKDEVPRREAHFYGEVAPRVRATGLGIPKLVASGEDPYWILLEHVPSKLPNDRWQGDQGIAIYLARWHQMSSALLAHSHMKYVYVWDPQTLEQLSGFVDAETLRQIGVVIDRHREGFDALFEPICGIHGDPNPTNWLLTASGDLVLIDWSRYGMAHPAIDLAISLGGLPDWDVIRHLARQYHVQNPRAVEDLDALVLAIALGKLWTYIDFLAMAQRGELSTDGDSGLRMLQLRLGPWITSLFE